jgi:pSer/pThr/pTyr-binding forkhead associated (FHA) protein
MKISQNLNIISSQNINKINKNKTSEHKAVSHDFSTTRSNNITFNGLFNFNQDIKDARYLAIDFRMEPQTQYLVSDDSVFRLGPDFYLDLSSEEVKPLIDKLKPLQTIVFGKESTFLQEMTPYVSREHLQIKKNIKGELIATDLNSTNGSTINRNVFVQSVEYGEFQLEPHKKYLLPKNSILRLGRDAIFPLNNHKKEIKSLKRGEKLVVGREDNCDIILSSPKVSREHFSIEKYDDNNVLIKDLGSTNGTFFNSLERTASYVNDFSNLTDIATLQKNVPTRIPNDCQLYLGNNFTIDVRNPNILNLLEERGSITIGRNPSCDLSVSEFYDQVSNTHLKLEKIGNDIVATDLNATNNTDVIPKNKIRPFYTNLKNLQLGQANVGDCYLLATIYSLSKTQRGREILLNMVQVDNQGNYIVNFSDKKGIIVKPEELDGQKKGKEEKRSVSGDLGIKAIERAYAKLLKEEQEKILFLPQTNKTMFLAIDKGGFMNTAIKKMTGLDSHVVNTRYNDVDAILTSLAYNNPEDYIITCSTPSNANYGDYVDPCYKFIKKHAYSIKSINSTSRTVEIINPHNTKFSYIISFDDFKNMFDFLCYAKTK